MLIQKGCYLVGQIKFDVRFFAAFYRSGYNEQVQSRSENTRKTVINFKVSQRIQKYILSRSKCYDQANSGT